MKPLTEVAEIQVSYRPAISNKPVVKSPLDAYNVVKSFFLPEQIGLQEKFVVAYMNQANRVIGVYDMTVGGITGTVADIRLIFGTALKTAATGIILAHNHPSGNLVPSQQDIDLTFRIKEAGRFLSIKLYDHLILSPESTFYSMADGGDLSPA